MTRYAIYEGPEGPLLIAVDEDGRVVRLHFVDGPLPIEEDWQEDASALASLSRQLDEIGRAHV